MTERMTNEEYIDCLMEYELTEEEIKTAAAQVQILPLEPGQYYTPEQVHQMQMDVLLTLPLHRRAVIEVELMERARRFLEQANEKVGEEKPVTLQ